MNQTLLVSAMQKLLDKKRLTADERAAVLSLIMLTMAGEDVGQLLGVPRKRKRRNTGQLHESIALHYFLRLQQGDKPKQASVTVKAAWQLKNESQVFKAAREHERMKGYLPTLLEHSSAEEWERRTIAGIENTKKLARAHVSAVVPLLPGRLRVLPRGTFSPVTRTRKSST